MPENDQNQQLTQSGSQATPQVFTEEESQGVKRTPLRRKILCGIFCISSIVSIVLLILNFIDGSTWRYDIYDYLILILEITLSLGLIPVGILLNTEYKPSRLIKIFGGLFGLGGIIVVILSLSYIIEDWKYNSIEDYFIFGLLFLFSLGLILIGVLINYTQKVEAYYHPSLLTKILSGAIRFIGISLIWSGLSNFLLIGFEDLSFIEILIATFIIILCGICFIYLGRLLYSSKKIVNLGVTLLFSIISGVCLSLIVDDIGGEAFGEYDDTIKQSIAILGLYFYLITIIWGIRCFRLKRGGKANGKMLSSEPSSKKIGYITTGILFLILIANVIYGKIQWSKIPEIDDSIFNRKEHQTKLPDEEDALVQLRNHNNGNINNVFNPLDSYYLDLFGNNYNLENNKDISWKQYPKECSVIYSGGNEYCGTWIWDEKTLDRVLNNYYYLGNTNMKDFYDSDGYLSIDGEKVTIFEYIQKNESEIKAEFQELDRIASLDYYLPDDEILNLIPSYFQGFARASMVTLRYYIDQKDWDMVMFIIKLNYKIIDIFNTSGSVINQLISIVIQGIIDSCVNSYVQLFPKDFRIELIERYSTQIHSKSEIYDRMVRGEYVMWNRAKAGNILGDVGYGAPSLSQFLFHFPFFSSKEINNLMNYSYYHFWNSLDDTRIDINDTGINIDDIIYSRSLYNRYGKYPFSALMPRFQSINDRMDRALYHKDALIKNLESGKYDVRFNKPDWESNPYEYESYRLPTDEELFENKIKEYSDITNPCFGKDIMDDPFFDFGDFGNICSQTLSELKEQENDNFGLREILIEISQLWIDYDKIGIEVNNCFSEKGDICESIFSKQYEILEKMKKTYIKFSDTLETIKNNFPEINIDEYFYISEMMYNKGDDLGDLGDLELDDTKSNDLEVEYIELPESLNIIKEYSNIIQPCFGKDIIDPIPTIGVYHDEFEEICHKTLKDLKELEKDKFGLKEILIEITKSLINHSKFETKVDACWLKEGILPKACEEIFDKGDELVNKVRENYIKLSEVLENIENENPGINMDEYFYIPYNKVHDKNNGIIVGFIIDQEKAEQILKDIESQEAD